MNLLVLNSEELRKLIHLDELRLIMKEALLTTSYSQTISELRNVTNFNENNALGVMPAINSSKCLVGYKAVTVYPKNAENGINPHQGMVTLLDYESGQIKCIMDGSTITALRTAAVSALATDLLSRVDSETLAIVGAGRQAHEHYQAISRVRSIKEIKIFNRTKEKASQLADLIARESNAIIIVVDSPIEAVKDADIVVTCTAARIPLFSTLDLKPGCHVNAIGACRPGFAEVDVMTNEKLKIFVDHFGACSVEADEILKLGKEIFLFTSEIGQVLGGTRSGRENDEEITFFKSVGIAAEDIFAGELAYQKAMKEKIGVSLQFT